MSRSLNGIRKTIYSLARPLALQNTAEGVLLGIFCLLAVALVFIADVLTPAGHTYGALSVVPVVAAAWLASRRVAYVVGVAAVVLRILAVQRAGVFAETGIAQLTVIAALGLLTRFAAQTLVSTQESGSRASLISRIARIATSSDRLNVILYGVLDEMSRFGYPGALIALVDERGELYPAAVEGTLDRESLEERLLAVSQEMKRAFTEARSVLVQDLSASRSEPGRGYPVRSVMIVPLRAAGRVLGVIELDSPQPRKYNEDDCLLLENAGLAVSGAVQRAGSLQLADEQLRRRLKEVGLLLETARTLSASLDLDHVQRAIVRSAADLVSHSGRQGVRASLFRVEGETATFIAEFDENGIRLLNQRFPLQQHRGLVEAIESRRAAIWDFAGAEVPLADLVEQAQVRSGAFAPIHTGSTLFGVLSAASRDARPFDAEELRLLEGIADLAGLAISNAQRLGLELSRSQQLRDHADRMQSLEKTKSEFLRLASHELRGPIAILRGYISMLSEGTLGELPPQVNRVLPMLTEKVTDMNHLIDQMLETARLEDTRLQLHLELVDLAEVLRDSAASLELKAASAKCPLHLDIATPVPAAEGNGSNRVSVLADPDRLSTIVVNLIDNAIKYSPGGGEVECRLWVDNPHACISVADHGVGIDEADMDRLFTRFGRIVTPDNSHILGTGLGLYLSRELARMHGGDITVVSQKRVGTTFTLRLPLAVERLHTLAAEPASAHSTTAPPN